MSDTAYIQGEGGTVFEMDLPLPSGIAQRLEAGALVRVADADGTPYSEPDPPSEPPGATERPKDNASTIAWAAYAISQGATDEDVEGLSRADLIELYGG